MKYQTPTDAYEGFPHDSLDHSSSQKELVNPPPLPEVEFLPTQRKPNGTGFPFRGKP